MFELDVHPHVEPAAETTEPVVDAATLYRRHHGFVASFIVRMGIVSRSDVDDLVQEVFLAAHRKGGYREGTARPTTWLAEIAVFAVSNFRRGKRRKPTSSADCDMSALDAIAEEHSDPEQVSAARQAMVHVNRALESLSVEQRAVFVLYEIEGESCADIAVALGVAVGTVYSRLHTARQEFLARYARTTGAGPGPRAQVTVRREATT